MNFNPTNIQDNPYNRTVPGVNLSTTANILHGSPVFRDESVTQTDDASGYTQKVRRTTAIFVPADTAAPGASVRRLVGLVQSPSGTNGFIKPGQVAKIVVAGLARARIRVPTTTVYTEAATVPEGTLLALGSLWDATNDWVEFNQSETALATNYFSGWLEPLVYNKAIVQPFNPVAVLREAITATASVQWVEAWVDVIPWHQPKLFQILKHIATAANKTQITLGLTHGPGEISGAIAQLLAVVTVSGALTVNVGHGPLGATADHQAVYTTALQFDDAGSPSAGAVAGPHGGDSTTGLCGLDGDTDTANVLGTSGSNGVLAALAIRQFSGKELLTLTLAGTPGGGATDLAVNVFGLYY